MLTTAKKSIFKQHQATQISSLSFGSNYSHQKENTGQEIIWHLMPFKLLVVLVTIVIVAKLFYLQIARSGFYTSVSQENKTRETIIRAQRGVVVDRNGVVIARNQPQTNLWFLHNVSQDGLDTVIQKLSQDLNVAPEYLTKKITTSFTDGTTRTLLKSNLNTNEATYFESFYAKYLFIAVEKSPSRDNLYPYETAHLLGFVSQISPAEIAVTSYRYSAGALVGKTGIEKEYEKYLRGTDGVLLSQVDSNGSKTALLGKKDAVSGDSLELNLDIGLQKAIYDIVLKFDKDNPKAILGSAVVVSNVANGQILALISYPSFNASLFNEVLSPEEYAKLVSDPRIPLYNRAISGAFPPGSVYKLITLVAALEERAISAEYQVTVPGFIAIGPYIYRDWKESGHGLVDAERALAVSSDVYFYALGGGWSPFGIKGLGVEKMAEWSKKFGLGKTLGIDLPGEEAGFLPSKEWKQQTFNESWYIGDDFITAIGQGFILTTPLQINSMTAVVANGGTLYKPQVVANIKLVSGETIKKSPEIIRANIVSGTTAKTVLAGMTQACSLGGTAYPLFNFVPQLACKTGTAEFGEKLATGYARTHAWITVIAPAQNPEVAITVFLEGGGEGSRDAGAVAREILNYMKEQGLLK